VSLVPEIWVLGSKHARANRCVEWRFPFPNFADADILIINMQSLSGDQLSNQELKAALSEEARRYVFDMLMTGEKNVIVIMSSESTQLNWLPLYPIYKPIAPLKLGKIPDNAMTNSYLKNVERCPYYFYDVNFRYFVVKTDPESGDAERYYFSAKAKEGYFIQKVAEHEIFNAANQTIGGAYRVRIFYGRTFAGLQQRYEGTHSSGAIFFLPPPTKVKAEVAIDSLIDFFVGVTPEEPIAPKWENEIDMPKLAELGSELSKKEKQVVLLNEEVKSLEGDIGNVTRFRRLLWTNGKYLELIVRDAFIILGFPEIRKIRAENLEDWVIDFKHMTEFKHGVLEVKASEKRTSMADLTQCNKWVEDYLLENEKVKGIFIPNQYRLTDVRTSSDKREEFAPNELEYAKKREICILSSHEIFSMVTRKMKDESTFTREAIEKKIVASNGLCCLTRKSSSS